MNLKRYLIFILDKDPDRPDAKVRFRVKWTGGMAAFSVGYRVESLKWSPETQRCNKSTTHGEKKVPASTINRTIQQYQDITNSLFDAYENEDKNPTPQQFRDAFNKAIGKLTKVKEKSSVLASEYFDRFISDQGTQNNWSDATITKFNTLKSHLIDFDDKLMLSKINDTRLTEFLQFQHRIPLRNTTIAKNVSLMNWFLRWAHRNKYYPGDSHNTFRPRLKGIETNPNDLVYLSWEELHHLLNFKIPPEEAHLEKVRDVFCFCCFTSLRYSDVKNLKRSDIWDDCMHITTVKTTDSLKIELNKYARAILEKYSDMVSDRNLALPVISNVKMNLYLKDLGKLAGFDSPHPVVYYMGGSRIESVSPKHELLTTHCGRRTFIVNALYLGIPAEVVMKFTGHADFKAMKPYVKIIDSLKRKEMSKFDDFEVKIVPENGDQSQ